MTTTRARWTPSATSTAAFTRPAEVPEELAVGSAVGEYVIEREIGAGGMGVVYGARHPIIGKRAAIKVLNRRYSADPEAVARFVQEAQAVNQIGHANIVDIFGFGTLADGRAYFVMEWLPGESLQDRLTRGPIALADALPILIALTRALEAVHGAGVVHRDLKPDNVFLLEGEDEPRIKLLDFGIAKLSSGSPTINRTATGVVMGTPLFMSPEQARGDHIDERTDLYALGVIAYHLVCGETPFGREPSAIEILAAHICKPPPLPHDLRPDTPPALEALILAMLAKAPEDRPALAEVRRQLAAIAAPPPVHGPSDRLDTLTSQPDLPAVRGGPSSAISIIRLEPAPPIRRRGLAWAGAAAVALGALVFVAVGRAREDAAPPLTASAPPPRVTSPAPRVTPPAPRPAAAPPRRAAPAPVASPAPEPADGLVVLAIEPASAVAILDGRPIPLTRGRTRLALAPGEHRVEVTARGRAPIERPFTIAPDETTTLNLHLERKKRTPRGGRARTPDADAVLNPFTPQVTHDLVAPHLDDLPGRAARAGARHRARRGSAGPGARRGAVRRGPARVRSRRVRRRDRPLEGLVHALERAPAAVQRGPGLSPVGRLRPGQPLLRDLRAGRPAPEQRRRAGRGARSAPGSWPRPRPLRRARRR